MLGPGVGDGIVSFCLMRIEFQFCKIKRVLEVDGDDVGTATQLYFPAHLGPAKQ